MSDDLNALARLDNDSLKEVFDWLPLACIFKLRQTGDVALCRALMMQGALKRLVVDADRFHHTILSLTAYAPKEGNEEAQPEKRRSILNPSLGINLDRVYHIGLYSAEELYPEFSERIATLLASFPHLTRLRYYVYEDSTLLAKSLPNQLLHLDIAIARGVEVGAFIAELPRALESLSLVFAAAPSDWRDVVLNLPPNLTTLVCRLLVNVTSDMMAHLPRSLTRLELSGIDRGREIGDCLEPSTIALLPPDLVHLHFIGYDPLNDDSIRMLPCSLRFLSMINNETLSNQGIALLPRHLTHLNLKMNAQLDGNCLKVLPRQLTYLNALNTGKFLTSDQVAQLPQTLTALHMYDLWRGFHVADNLAQLPRNLRTLSARNPCCLTEANINVLPPLLKYWDVGLFYLRADRLHSNCIGVTPYGDPLTTINKAIQSVHYSLYYHNLNMDPKYVYYVNLITHAPGFIWLCYCPWDDAATWMFMASLAASCAMHVSETKHGLSGLYFARASNVLLNIDRFFTIAFTITCLLRASLWARYAYYFAVFALLVVCMLLGEATSTLSYYTAMHSVWHLGVFHLAGSLISNGGRSPWILFRPL